MERLAQAVVIGGTTLVITTINAMVLGTLIAFNFEVAKALNPPPDVDCDDSDACDCSCHCEFCEC